MHRLARWLQNCGFSVKPRPPIFLEVPSGNKLRLVDVLYTIQGETYFPNDQELNEVQNLINDGLMKRDETRFYLAGRYN